MIFKDLKNNGHINCNILSILSRKNKKADEV